MKGGIQTSLPFVEKLEKEKATKLSLNRDKFTQYLLKSIEITLDEARELYEQIEAELLNFKGENELQFLERLISSRIDQYPVRKPEVQPKVSLTDNAKIVLEKRYLRKDDKGKIIETPEQLFERVAKSVAMADRFYMKSDDVRETEDKFYQILSQLSFLPNSPTLMNAGTELGQLSACFVLPIEDSMDSIFETLKQTAIIQKSGGGTGFNFSNLRAKNSRVKTTCGTSSGPLSFISVFNSVTDTIKQGGTRRGANMAILNVDHPDILEFIHSKEIPGNLTNFNISVALTEGFMKAAKNNEDYPLMDPASKEVVGKLNASYVFNQIVEAAWKTGDPGLVFIDRINERHPVLNCGKIEATNPCGEQVLLPYESCNLGSINLTAVLKSSGDIDWSKLENITKAAVHFLDNVIDVNHYAIPQIEQITKSNRKIGLGVMGLADVLIQKNIPYNSEDALALAEQLMSFISKKAHDASEELAESRGAFPNFKHSTFAKEGRKPLRNATVTTIAPTGTLSIIAGCSSGIEPIFSKSFTRHVLEGESLSESYPENTVTAHEVSPEWHVRMQALFQKYSDNAVSKTVNLPNSASTDDVRNVYWLAYDMGCKGVTVFRDRSKESQVLVSTGGASPVDVKTTQDGKVQITVDLKNSFSKKESELLCPECQSPYTHEESCTYCKVCGYTKCA